MRKNSVLRGFFNALIIMLVAIVVAVVGLAVVQHRSLKSLPEDPGTPLSSSPADPDDKPGLQQSKTAPWAPGTMMRLTKDYPQAGVPFEATECTAAMSFTGADGQAYAVTASHCGAVGELVWPSNGATIEDYRKELGKVVYSGLYQPANGGDLSDVAIIKLTNTDRKMEVAGDAPQDTVLETASSEPQTSVCKLGGTTKQTCGKTVDKDRTYLMDNRDEGGTEVHAIGDTAQLCAQKGDSGGPLLSDQGGRTVIIGLVSGTRSDGGQPAQCGDNGAGDIMVSYVSSRAIVKAIHAVVPDAQITQL